MFTSVNDPHGRYQRVDGSRCEIISSTQEGVNMAQKTYRDTAGVVTPITKPFSNAKSPLHYALVNHIHPVIEDKVVYESQIANKVTSKRVVGGDFVNSPRHVQ